jgi:hypothetical protein
MLNWDTIRKQNEYTQPKTVKAPIVKAPVVQAPKISTMPNYAPGGSFNVPVIQKKAAAPEVDEGAKRESLINRILGNTNKKKDDQVLYSPSVRRIGQPLAQAQREKIKNKTYEDFNDKPTKALAGFIEGVLPVSTDQNYHPAIQANKEDFTDNLAYKGGEMGGIAAQFAMGYLGGGTAAVSGAKSIAPKLITGLENVGSKAVSKLPGIGAEAAERFGKSATESLVKDLAIGLPLNINQAVNKDDLKGTDALKSIGLNTGLDLALGGVLEAVPYILKSGKNIASKAEFDKLDVAEKLEVIKGVDKVTNGADKEKVIQDFKASTDNDLVEFAKQALKDPNSVYKYKMNPVNSKEAADIEKLTGINVSEFNHSIKSNSIKHIDRRHGVNGAADNSMGDLNDIGRMKYVIDNYDDVILLDKNSKEFRNSDNTPAQLVQFKKRINGTYYIVEAVPDSKAKELQIVSAYIKKAEPQVPNVNIPRLNAQDGLAESASNPNLSQLNQNINTEKITNNEAIPPINEGSKVKALDRDNIGTVQSRNPDGSYNVKFVSPEGYEATKTFKADQLEDLTVKPNNPSGDIYTKTLEKDKEYKLSAKGERYQKRQENNFINDVARSMNITKYADRKGLKPIVNEVVERLKKGPISEEETKVLFERMYDQGIVTMDNFYKEYKHIKDYIRNGSIKVSEEDIKNIPDFNQFRKDNLGSMKLSSTEGTSIEQKYREIMDAAPGILPEVNTTSEMLEEMASLAKSINKTEYSLDQYMGPEAGEFKEFAFEEFRKSMDKLGEEARVIQRFAESSTEKAEKSIISIAEAKEIYKNEAMLKRQAEKVVNSTLLTKKDNVQVDRLLKGEITLDELPEGVNAADIKKVYEAKAAAQEAYRPIKEYNDFRKQNLRDTAETLLENSDKWKDKKMGLQFKREMEERNLVDVAGKVEGEALIKQYITPVHNNEAKRNVMLNTYRDNVRALKIQEKEIYDASKLYGTIDSARKNKVSESALVQMYGEKKITAEQLQDVGADVEKIQKAVKAIKGLYDDLIDQANETLIRNGYRPIEYRQDYFPHFEEEVPDTILRKVASKLGFNIIKDELPTDIAGLTYAFKPGKKWFGNALQRKGDSTEFDALKGFDMYVEGISDVIHHTDDIQRLRALENQLRYKYSEDGMKEQIDDILAMDITEADKDDKLSKIYEQSKSQLGNFARHIRAYTDNLAGKKPMGDRMMEEDISRGIYSFTKQMENKVAANMVAVNPASWLTNLIPLTQGAEVKLSSTMKALDATIRSYAKDDHFKEMSDFLINRKGSEQIVKTKTQKISNALASPMKYIDEFTTEILTRAKYYDEIAKGNSSEEAIASADRFAASVVADRSKGGLPLVFESKNPVQKLVTMFQVEVNNQLSYLFKDLPRNTADQGKVVVANALMKYMIGAYLYNDFYEKAIGRRPALDPIGMLNDFSGDLTGYQLPNVIDAGINIANGLLPSVKTDQKKKTQAIGGLATDAVESLPFVGGLIGGGRIPISSALPNVKDTLSAASGLATGEMNNKKAAKTLINEISKPVFYMLPPTGGGQAKKLLDTAITINKAGSYGMDKDGNDLLQFPVDKTAGNAAKSAVFGKYSLPGANDWVENGFKTMGKTVTEGWKDAAEAGIKADQFLYTYREVSKVESDKYVTGEKKGKTIPLSESKNIKAAIDRANKGATNYQLHILYKAFGVPEKVIAPEIIK